MSLSKHKKTKKPHKIEEASLRKALLSMEKRLVKKFDKVDGRFEQMNRRFDHIDQNLVQVDKRFDKPETKLDTNTTGLVDLIERRAGEIISLF